MFLSQPPIATRPSKPSAPITVSIESAITSRDTSEYFMPSVPIGDGIRHGNGVKITGLAPAFVTPSAACRASASIVHVARRHLAPGRADTDLRLGEVGAREADSMQHRAPRRAFGAIQYQRGVRSLCHSPVVVGILLDR
jgi:hypothetical protein